MVKCLPTMRETWVQSLGWEDLLEKEMATHSRILAWRIPWTEEPGGLQSTGLNTTEHTHIHGLPVCAHVSCSVMSDSAIPRTVVCQTPLSVGFSRQKYWSGLPFPSPGDLPHSGIEPGSPALQAGS